LTTLTDDLRSDFLRARDDLLAARRDQQARDCLAHRTAIEAQLANVDAVLDLYLDLYLPVDGRTAADAEDRQRPVTEAA
jgi:hypothetical protein